MPGSKFSVGMSKVKLSPVWLVLSRSLNSLPFDTSSGSRKISTVMVLSGSETCQETVNCGLMPTARSNTKLSRGELKNNCGAWLTVSVPLA